MKHLTDYTTNSSDPNRAYLMREFQLVIQQIKYHATIQPNVKGKERPRYNAIVRLMSQGLEISLRLHRTDAAKVYAYGIKEALHILYNEERPKLKIR